MDMLAFSKAFNETFGLVATFIGIGVVVNVLIVYIVIQVRGGIKSNQEQRAEHRRRLGRDQPLRVHADFVRSAAIVRLAVVFNAADTQKASRRSPTRLGRRA